MEMKVIPMMEIVMEAITQNLTISVWLAGNDLQPVNPKIPGEVVMVEDAYVCPE